MLEVKNVSLFYDKHQVVDNLSFKIEKGTINTIIGPNGCGKSTLLKAISKNKKIKCGEIIIDSIPICEYTNKNLAKKLAILPQSPIVPDDFTVKDLVTYGRYPYLNWTGRLKKEDYEIINWAIEETGISHLQHRQVATMSGGERQSAWISMALAQKPKILLLDEPTTYLDISHQYEVLELIKKLNVEMNITVIMVLHDLNQASRYSDNIIVMKNGKKIKEGIPQNIITKETLKNVFNVDAEIYEDKINKYPYFVIS